MTSTVTNLDDHRVLSAPPPPPNDPQVAESIRQGEAAAIVYRQAISTSRDMIVPMALGLAAARRAYPADREFGAWLQNSPYCEIEKTDRAALIKLGEHADFAAKFIKQTRYASPELIWNAMRELLPPVSDDRKPGPEGTTSPESAESPSPPAETRELANPENPNDGGRQRRRRPFAFQGRKRADEFLEIFTNHHTRSALGHVPQRAAWGLLVRALAGGLLPKSTDTVIKKPTMRLIFPYGSVAFCNQYDLTNTRDRIFVTSILPRAIELKARVLAEPERLKEILDQDRRDRNRTEQAAVVGERARKALAALPADEAEVIMFGKRMWPLVPGETIGAYDFKTLQVAIWKFTDLNRWLMLGEKNPHGRSIMIRNSTKWDRHFIGEMTKGTDFYARIDRIYALVHALCSMMEQNPDGECREPMTPLVLG